jgi:rubrerythrin
MNTFDPGTADAQVLEMLQRLRAAEKEQALYYRSLASQAEGAGEEALAQRFHGLHADEQHHLSRLTARLLELGAAPDDLSAVRAPARSLAEWEPDARRREQDEIRHYEVALVGGMDAETRAILEQILESERAHARELGGKWMPA